MLRTMRLTMRPAVAAILCLVAVACANAGASTSPGPSGGSTRPSGSSGTSASPAPSLAEADLKYRLVDQLGRPLFCDPDEYPVAREDVGKLAKERLPAIRADAPTYAAITSHLGINGSAPLTDHQTLAIYTDWKMLRALVFQPNGQGTATFDFIAGDDSGQGGTHVTGTIDGSGAITVASREPSGPPPCPICLARGTLVATPSGNVPVEDLGIGEVVWTRDGAGRRVAAPIVELGSVPVPSSHEVVDLILADGREVRASPGHPLADGRPLGDLRPGDRVDGSRVVSAALVGYAGGATFDLLPAGDTGVYWADGIPLGSTLH
jgi:hypothetical protein